MPASVGQRGQQSGRGVSRAGVVREFVIAGAGVDIESRENVLDAFLPFEFYQMWCVPARCAPRGNFST